MIFPKMKPAKRVEERFDPKRHHGESDAESFYVVAKSAEHLFQLACTAIGLGYKAYNKPRRELFQKRDA